MHRREQTSPIFADAACERNAFIAMDRWLTAVERDHGARSTATKVATDRPADVTDECWTGVGVLLWHSLCGEDVVPVYGTSRMVAGDDISTDNNKCRLKPLDRSSYHVTIAGVTIPIHFTGTQWVALERVFPTGVCDFSQPGIDQQPTLPWQTYQHRSGKVIFGGRPLGPAPTSRHLS